MADLNTEIKIGADASGVEAGVGKAKRSLASLGDAAKKAGKDAAGGMAGIGTGADASAKKVESATRNMVGSLQRQIAAMDAGDKSSRKYQETLARMRGVDVAKLKPYLDQLDSLKVKTTLAERASASFNSVMFKATAVLAATAAIGAYGRAIVDGIDAMNDLSDATGASIENISALDRIARETGGNFDGMSSALVKFNMVLKDADPDKGAGAVLKALNLDIAELKALDPAEAMRQVAVALESYASSGDKARAIQELFGKSVKEAAPFLKDLAEAGKLNAAVTTEQAEQVERFNKELFKLSAYSEEAGRSMTINLVTAMNQIIESFRAGEKASDSFFAGYWGGVRGFYEATGILDKASKGSRSVSGGILDLTNQSDSETARLSRGAPPKLQLVIPGDKPKGSRGSGASAAASAIKAEQSAYDNLITSIKTKIELDKAELAGNAALTESQQMRVKLDADMAGGRLKLTEAHEQEIRAALNALGASEALMKSRKLEIEQATAAAEAYASALESRQSAADSVADQVAQERESIAAMGLSKIALAELEAAKLSETAATKLRLATIADEIDWTGKLGAAYREEAAQLQQLAGLKREGAAKQEGVDAAAAVADEWKKTSASIEDALTDALMRGFENGKGFGENLGDTISNYFKTTVAKEIAAAITRAIMSAMASTQWGQILSGALGGAGGGGDWISMATKAYQAYSGGGGGGAAGLFGGGAAAAGGASAYGSSYAAGSVSNAAMVSTGSTAAAGGTASSTMASGGFTGYGYLGYAALIAAAVMIAENLYSKGYTRAALGKGPGQEVKFGQYSGITANNSMGNSSVYNASAENLNRKLFDAVGVNSKWADILSGTTRMATLFGRKLGAYGYEASVSGGDAEVSGFARYKGGLFRSNKTVKADVDPRDAANFDAVVENQIESSRALARAMGLSGEAIDGYTGKIRVNFKNAKTAEEQSKRMAEAMENLNFELLKTASGGKLAREDFKAFMEGVQKDIETAGINAGGITDIILAGMTGRMSGADVGAQLSDMILGGIYNAIAGSAAAQISQLFMQQIITPIFTAIASGVPVAQAVSAASIKATVETAKRYMEVVKATFNDPEFKAFMEELRAGFTSAGEAAAGTAAPSMRTYGPTPGELAAQEAKREREQLERQILQLQGNTTELRRRELLDVGKGNRALQQRIWALEDEQEAISKVTELQDAWKGLTDSIASEIDRLRGIVAGESMAGLAYVQAQFTIATGAARAMDQTAAGKLPDLSSQLADLYLNNSGSQSEYQSRVNSLSSSLEETNRITRLTAGIGPDSSQQVEDKALAQKIELLQKSIDVLVAAQAETAKHSASTAKVLVQVTNNGNGMRNQPA